MNKVLLVEDNLELGGLIQGFLNKDGFCVHHVKSGEDAVLYLSHNQVSLVVLDIMLPGIDGFAVCAAIRKMGSVPVLIMSAKSDKQDKLSGYELGADDYIEKPVDPEILSAKIRALITRSYGRQKAKDVWQSGGLMIDINRRKAALDGMPVELNVKEFELLLLLAKNPGKTLHKDYLFNQIWGADSSSENQTLTVHIKMLRSKIEEEPRNPKRIQTVWGIGYRYEEI